MTTRQRKKQKLQHMPDQTAGKSSGDVVAKKDVLQRLGLGSVQGWLLGVVAALTAATLLLNSDGLTHDGDNILIALVWQLLAAVLLIMRWHRKTPLCFDDVTSQQDVPQDNINLHKTVAGWRWFDVIAAIFFGWVFVSFAGVWLSDDGAPRAMLTMLAHWGGFAAMFVVWRLLLNNRLIVRGMLSLLVALVIAETTTAYYDYLYLGPQRRAEFSENREQVLSESNALSQGERELMANRIENVEPLGTYSLTNSLAGVLTPWCVFLCGLLLLGRNRIELPRAASADDQPDLHREKLRRWRFMLLSAILAAFVGFILLATNSRSGVLATLFGVVCLLGYTVVTKMHNKRILYGSIIAACIAVVVGLGIGFATGKFNGETIANATKSFGYRIQYWQSSSHMIADHPTFGCGIGNFREYYTQYKLPTASETIADPHNLFFEVATNAGLPALICFVVLLAAAVICALASKARNAIPMQLSAVNSCDASLGHLIASLSTVWQRHLPMIIGGAVGVAGASAYSYTNYAPMSLDMAGFALFGFLVGCGVAFPLINAIRFPMHVLAPICLVVLTINLLAAGGISFPHVNVTFWFLAALCFACATAGTTEPSKAETTKSQQANIAFLCAALCFLVLVVALYPMAWLSNLQANTIARNMEANPAQFVFFDKQIAEFEKIVKHDPHRTQVWIELCNAYLMEQREFPELAKQRPGTSNWQDVVNLQLSKNHCREDLPQLDRVTLNGKAADALVGAVKSSPKSALMYRRLGQVFLNDFEQTQNAGSLDLATVLFELAAARYPNHAEAYANLAACYRLAGNTDRQIENAGKAIELDDITPHSDQKMPPELRQLTETLAKN